MAPPTTYAAFLRGRERTIRGLTARVEVILRFVLAPGLRPPRRRAAATGRRMAAHGLDALDSCDAAERAVSRMTGYPQKQPRDGTDIRGVDAGRDFGGNFATIVMFPGRPCIMLSDDRSLFIIESRFRRLQRPIKPAVRAFLANIDLKSCGMGPQHQLGVSGRLYLGRNLRVRIHGEDFSTEPLRGVSRSVLRGPHNFLPAAGLNLVNIPCARGEP